MKIIDWNISYSNAAQPKIDFLKSVVGKDSFIAILQEVTPLQAEVIKKQFENVRYSLDYRKPGKFDTKQRQLGVAIICSDDMNIISADALTRCLLPDRTLMVDVEYQGKSLRVIGLHSLTGVAHKKAKSIQFLSFAEAVDEFSPDIVAFDANEPAKDHYDIKQMEFFDNQDNGMGARTFFETLIDAGMKDAYLAGYDKQMFCDGEPLAVSHRFASNGLSKRYDFVFTKGSVTVSQCDYLYDDAVKAGSDHAMIVCETE